MWLNDLPAGEYTLNAALAGHYGAPILMASGDQTACAQMLQQLGSLETAVVKQAAGRFSATCLAPELTAGMIQKTAELAVRRLTAKSAPNPYIVNSADSLNRRSCIVGYGGPRHAHAGCRPRRIETVLCVGRYA